MNKSVVVENLGVSYGPLPVLRHVHFEAAKGEFVAVVGKSGSGKSSFLHAIAGFVPFSGSVRVFGKLGVVFQQQSVFPWLTVEGNIGFGVSGLLENRKQTINEHIALAKLEGKKHMYPAELSGGQIQRVALARCLANNPDILLMDEPYGALDIHTRESMQQWLLDVWAANKKTVIFVTHDTEEAVLLADRVLVLGGESLFEEFLVPFSKPRDGILRYSPEFIALRQRIHKLLK